MEEKEKKMGFNIIKNNPVKGHKGFGIGVLSLDNVSPVFIDVEERGCYRYWGRARKKRRGKGH